MAKQETPELITTDQQQVGEVYAKALFGVGEKSGSTEDLISELKSVNRAIVDLPKLSSTLTSPQIGTDQKIALVEKAFSGRISKPMMNFLKVIVQKGRFDCPTQDLEIAGVQFTDKLLQNSGRGKSSNFTLKFLESVTTVPKIKSPSSRERLLSNTFVSLNRYSNCGGPCQKNSASSVFES